jgi:probable HAF family extracellular repeat protein
LPPDPPCDVNDSGEVVGTADTSGNGGSVAHAFSWTQAGGMIDLGTLGGIISGARAVNDSVQVVGTFLTSANDIERAIVWQTPGP